MRIVLCATDETIARLWKVNLKKTGHKRKIVKDEEALMAYLLKHEHSQTIVCIEDIWAGANFEDIKELMAVLKGLYPNLPILVLSRYPNYSTGKAVLTLGANGYGNSKMLPVHLQDAISCIKKGDIWVYPEFVQLMIKSINGATSKDVSKSQSLEVLTPREREVAELIYDGYSNKEIASMSNITLRTVKAHTTSIYEKMGVKDRVALVLLLKNE